MVVLARSTDIGHTLLMEVDVHKAKAHFSRLLQRVVDGEEVIIMRAGVAVAQMVPVESKAGRRAMGMDEGEIYIADNFDSPLPAQMLAPFLGSQVRQKPKRTSKRVRRKARKER